MSAVVSANPARNLRFYQTTVGKKFVMAVSGLLLFGFVVAHMAGNLQFFEGKEKLNHYAEQLRALPALLWAARIGLLVAVALHIWSSIQLALLQRAARPTDYARKRHVGSTYASRTMYWSGPIVGAFIVYHLLHLTWGVVHPKYEELNAYDNLVRGFENPVVSIFYLVAVGLLMMHLYHGVWSVFQTLGFSHPRWTPKLKTAAKAVSIVIFIGFAAIPLAVLAGIRP